MEVRVRQARASDKEPLMSFIKDVWGGHDYLPRVWDEWLVQKGGRMFVVEVDGVPVGMNRVRFLEDGSAWFEGVRVHPDYRGKGLASMLGENSMKFARRRGHTVYRLTSNSRNKAAHRQVARIGFSEVSRVSVYEPSKGMRFRKQRGVRRATPGDLAMVEGVIHGSKELALGAGVMWDSFTAVSLTREVVAAKVRDGSVLMCEDAVAISRPGREGRERWSQVCLLAGGTQASVRLVRHVFATTRAGWKFVYVPQGSPIVHALKETGLRRAFSLILFDRKAANG